MGKNFDAYEKAAQAQQAATARLLDVQGGSTAEAYTAAEVNLEQSDRIMNEARERFFENPGD